MSNYNLLIIGEEWEEKLNAYKRNNMNNCKKQYLKLYVEDKEGKEYYFNNEEEFLKSGINPKTYFWVNPNGCWNYWTEEEVFKLKYIAQYGQNNIAYPVCQAKIYDIDFEGMKKDSYEKYFEKFNKVKQIFNGNIPNKDFEQLGVREYLKAIGKDSEKYSGIFDSGDTLQDFQFNTPEEYALNNFKNIFNCYAVITEDGKMHIPNESKGFFGESREERHQFFNTVFDKIVENLSEDTLLTFLNCHD